MSNFFVNYLNPNVPESEFYDIRNFYSLWKAFPEYGKPECLKEDALRTFKQIQCPFNIILAKLDEDIQNGKMERFDKNDKNKRIWVKLITDWLKEESWTWLHDEKVVYVPTDDEIKSAEFMKTIIKLNK